MGEAHVPFVTERLVIRQFTLDDWAAIQGFASDLASSEAAGYDHPWPTAEEGCRGAAGYFAGRAGLSWAICLKDDGRLIGYASYNSIDDDGQMDLGHVFHSGFYREDYDTEALRCLVDHAFGHLEIRSIVANNAEAWSVQLAPLRKLGFRTLPRLDGAPEKASFRKDEHGNPIEFVGCRMGLTRDEWMQRREQRR